MLGVCAACVCCVRVFAKSNKRGPYGCRIWDKHPGTLEAEFMGGGDGAGGAQFLLGFGQRKRKQSLSHRYRKCIYLGEYLNIPDKSL